MTTACPHCHGPMADDVVVDMANNQVRAGADIVKLTASETVILSLIHNAAPNAVESNRIAHGVYGQTRDLPEHETRNEGNVLKVQICHLRQKTKHLPFTIETVWGKGYRYVPVPT